MRDGFLGSWATFSQQLESEPTLQHLREAISQQRFVYVFEKLDDIKQIFSSNPSPKLFSSHIRVAAIALLFHAMHINRYEEASSSAIDMAQLLLTNNENFLLFEHERTLLRKVYDDYRDDGPNRQVPLP